MAASSADRPAPLYSDIGRHYRDALRETLREHLRSEVLQPGKEQCEEALEEYAFYMLENCYQAERVREELHALFGKRGPRTRTMGDAGG